MKNINFKNDFKEILKEELNSNKIIYNDSDDLLKFMVMYYDVIKRIPIIGVEYNVIFSKYLNNKFSRLPVETQECINDIVNRLKSGKSITTYLSKSVLNANTKDNELQNWNIYHAHVKKVSLDYSKPAERSDLLLFFTVKDGDVYFIDVKSHPKSSGWFDKSLLEIIYDNWQYLLLVFEDVIGLEGELPDNKVHRASERLGILVTVRGKVVVPTNLGNTTAGNTIHSTMWAQKWIRCLNDLEKKIENNMDNIKSNIEKQIGNKIEKSLDMHLVKNHDNKYIIHEKNFNIYYTIN